MLGYDTGAWKTSPGRNDQGFSKVSGGGEKEKTFRW